MAIPINLFFRRNKDYGARSDIGSITFDVILNENHFFGSDVSTHNVENGSEISDHIRNQLENGTFTGLISNFSVKTRLLRTNRAQDAFDFIYKLWQERVLVTIVTVMRVYKNMAITSISIPRSFDTGESGIFEISFRKVNQVKLRTVVLESAVNVTNMDDDTNRQAAVTSDQGRTVGQ